MHKHGYTLMQAQISAADGREDAPRWNLLQWLQYWNTRQLQKRAGSAAVERTKSVTSIDDEADSRDNRRRCGSLSQRWLTPINIAVCCVSTQM